MSQLVEEKDLVGGLLRSELSRMTANLLSKTNELSKFKESVPGNVVPDCKFHNYLEGVEEPVILDKNVSQMVCIALYNSR